MEAITQLGQQLSMNCRVKIMTNIDREIEDGWCRSEKFVDIKIGSDIVRTSHLHASSHRLRVCGSWKGILQPILHGIVAQLSRFILAFLT